MSEQPKQEPTGVSAPAAERLAFRSAGLLWELSVAESELEKARAENRRLHQQINELLEALSTPQEAAGAPQTPLEGEGGGDHGRQAQDGP